MKPASFDVGPRRPVTLSINGTPYRREIDPRLLLLRTVEALTEGLGPDELHPLRRAPSGGARSGPTPDAFDLTSP
jgi:hypothetical protein